jgi:ATP-dependent Lon protease
MATVAVPRGKSLSAVEAALQDKQILGLLIPKRKLQALPPSKEEKDHGFEVNYDFGDLYAKGVSAKVLKRIHMPDGGMTLLVHGVQRFEVDKAVQSSPHLAASVVYFEDPNQKDAEVEALARSVIMKVRELSETNPFFTDEMKLALINTPTRGAMADLVMFSLSAQGKEAQGYIETTDVKERLLKLLVLLRKEQDLSQLQKRLSEEVDQKVNKIQREFFLREQLKSIKKELGIEEDDKSRETRLLEEKIAKAQLPEHALKTAKEEMRKLATIPEASPEFNLTRNYLDWLASLPWNERSDEVLDLNSAERILTRDHYGLEKVKDRILEFLAVRKLKPGYSGSILCFVGPPGVGKTSLGKSIAESLGREFFRFSLGGMRDEAEIKGHRRTYIGAMPGKILQGLKRVGKRNPVMLLDEIDKLGASYQGDPASALLEVLDPEQNKGFLDHYLDVPFDLSEVLFIATANSTATIPAALLDRMELIEIPGYTLEEKKIIAKRFSLPRALEKHGLPKEYLKIGSSTIAEILSKYSREPGLRSFQQSLDKIARKTARLKVTGRKKTVIINKEELQEWLGPPRFFNEMAERSTQPGVATGLAWTSMGGDILFLEAIATEGKGELKLTGQMGEVMLESARIAASHVKQVLSQRHMKLRSLGEGAPLLSVKEWFQQHDIHLHIPAGAVPKDGPSAGIAMATALMSLLLGKPVGSRLAMTGELSLVGKVLPVGGIKEKVLAAKRAGVNRVILPKLNERDLADVPKEHRKGVKFHFVSKVDEVFRLALH